MQIAVYGAVFDDIVGRELAPAGQFAKQIDIAEGDNRLFSFGKPEKCTIFRRREQAPALQQNSAIN
jgi:hypothetical protein